MRASARPSSTWSPGRRRWCWRAGPRPKQLLALYAPAPAVDRDLLAVLVAAFSGFLVRHSLQPPPPGLPTLRAFQAAQGAVALAWLRRRDRLVTPGAPLAPSQ